MIFVENTHKIHARTYLPFAFLLTYHIMYGCKIIAGLYARVGDNIIYFVVYEMFSLRPINRQIYREFFLNSCGGGVRVNRQKYNIEVSLLGKKIKIIIRMLPIKKKKKTVRASSPYSNDHLARKT